MKLQEFNLLLLLLIGGCTFNQNEKSSLKKNTYYFFDKKQVFKQDTVGSILSYSINTPVYSNWNDSLKVQISSRGHLLFHFTENDSLNKKDTVFTASKLKLDSIDYFNSEWLENEKNLIQFWDKSTYEKGGRADTLNIFLIEQKPSSDSFVFKRVHRFYMPGREG